LAATIGGCLAVYDVFVGRGWPLWGMAPVYVLAVFIIGAWVQNRLSVLVHEASHYSLFKNRVLNDVAANLFLLFPVFGAIANYRVGHWGHHRHVNDPQTDPDLQRLTRHQPRDFPVSKGRFLLDYVLKQILPHKAASYLKGRALYVAVPMKSEPVQGHDVLGKPLVLAMRLAYYGALFGTITAFGWWPHYLLFWVVPFLTFYPAVLFLREIAHHGNYPDAGDFTNSRVYKARWLEREIFFPFGEHNHVLHHMFPTIPHHKMRQAHEVMLRYPPYRDTVVTCNGFFVKADAASSEPTVLDVLAAPAEKYLRGRAGSPGFEGEIRRTTESEVGAVAEPRGNDG
jgi:fatty acid desaturase